MTALPDHWFCGSGHDKDPSPFCFNCGVALQEGAKSNVQIELENKLLAVTYSTDEHAQALDTVRQLRMSNEVLIDAIQKIVHKKEITK